MAETNAASHDRVFLSATIIANPIIHEGSGEGAVSELQILWKGPQPEPGQFFMLRLERSGVLLGRPISVFDSGRGLVSFLIAERGRGSRELVRAKSGEKLELTGPLGNSWPVLSGVHKPLALVGGGIGIAPLIYLAKTLAPESFHFYGGFRSRPYGLEGLSAQNCTIASEDGSAGHRGRIPDFFKPAPYEAVYACGPTPMLKRLTADCAKAGVPCFISLEERMACGVGACLGCTVRTTRGNRRCCADGPIFPAEEVLFDE